jgi:hypothetical protein
MGEGIDYDEVERMRKELPEAMKIISEKEKRLTTARLNSGRFRTGYREGGIEPITC